MTQHKSRARTLLEAKSRRRRLTEEQRSRWFSRYDPQGYYANYFMPLPGEEPGPGPGPTPGPGFGDLDTPLLHWMGRKRARVRGGSDDAEVIQIAMNVIANL